MRAAGTMAGLRVSPAIFSKCGSNGWVKIYRLRILRNCRARLVRRRRNVGEISTAEQSKLIVTATAVATVAHIAVCILTRLRCVGRARLRTATSYTNVLQSDARPVIFQNHGARTDCSHLITPLKQKSNKNHQSLNRNSALSFNNPRK